jgi:hypothetical protein
MYTEVLNEYRRRRCKNSWSMMICRSLN